MNQHEHSESVRAYLTGKLSTRERADFEAAIAADPELAREVALQRAEMAISGMLVEEEARDWFNQSFGAATRLRAAWYRNRFLQWSVAAVFALLAVAWWWFGKNPATPDRAPVAVVPLQTEPETGAAISDSLQAPPAPLPGGKNKITKPSYIAMADPADFIPNPALEVRIGGVRGNNDTEMELTNPEKDAIFHLTDGQVGLLVQGTLSADSLPVSQPLHLFIYSNRPKDWESKKTLFDLPLSLKPAGEGQYRVQVQQSLRLRPGLYYFLAAEQRSADPESGYRTLWVGKFTVTSEK